MEKGLNICGNVDTYFTIAHLRKVLFPAGDRCVTDDDLWNKQFYVSLACLMNV